MTTRHVEHEITVAVPARTVYSLIAEVGNWPRIFPPTRSDPSRTTTSADGSPRSISSAAVRPLMPAPRTR